MVNECSIFNMNFDMVLVKNNFSSQFQQRA